MYRGLIDLAAISALFLKSYVIKSDESMNSNNYGGLSKNLNCDSEILLNAWSQCNKQGISN